MAVCNFNYKYVKDNSTPGSFRRGYEAYKTNGDNYIYDVIQQNNVYKAKIKGNFKDCYETSLSFKKDKVIPNCSCPLKEPWCKHSIALAFKAIDEKAYDNYAIKQYKYEPDYSDEYTTPLEEPMGDYIFHFNPQRRQSFFSLLVISRNTGKVIRDLEGVLKEIVKCQKENPNFKLTNQQTIEVMIFQNLLKFSRLDKRAGWYDIQINKFEPFFQLMSKAEEVLDGRTKDILKFKTDGVWNLSLDVNFSMVGNVLLSLNWQRPDKDDILPFEEVRYFSRQLKWGRYKNIIFPINITINSIPQKLIKSSFTDIKDDEGAKFLYEELPKIKEIMPVNLSEMIKKLTLEDKIPNNVVTLGLDYDGSLKASLEFDYDGVIVPYSKHTNQTPYVTIKKPKEDLIYWVKRNIKHEEEAYRMLLACKFAPMQTNNLGMDKESAIDFYNYYMGHAPEGWVFVEKDDMQFFNIAKQKLEIVANIDFSTDTPDSFEVELSGRVGNEVMSLDEVHDLMSENNKYVRFKNLGFVEVPSSNLWSLLRTFNTFDVYKNDKNKYIVKTYRAGILSEMKNLEVVLEMSEKFEKFWKQISTFSVSANVRVPKKLNASLRDYQKKGFSWLWFLYEYGLNGILADDMGLGKTIQALTLLQKAKDKHKKQPNLVICPTSVVFNWESEIEKFTPDLSVLKLSGTDRKSNFERIKDYDIVITSYALLRRDIEDLKDYKFRYVILDESQNIKNPESITSKSVKMLNCTHKLALSGTPIENRLEELWSVFDFLMPGFLFDKSEFNHRYVNPIVEKEDKVVEKRLKSQIFPFILRRMKRDVAQDLPDKVENVAYCELTPEQKDFYLEVMDSTKEELFKSIEQNGLEKSRMSIFSALLRLRQICCHPWLYDKENKKGINESGKFEQLKEMLYEIIQEKHRVLLFSQFVDMLDIIKEWLVSKNIKFEYLTGATKDRQAAVERFNNNDDIPIFLVSLKAGGTGLNLTGADYVIHYDPWWNPAVEDQATDRAYRIGQTKKVFVYRLITKGTVEEKIQKLKQTKRNLVDSVISIDRNIGKSLTYQDLEDIFSLD